MTSTRRLPGIQVDVAPPPAVEALPRLDVAVFAGFAATGPLHLPVALESATEYARVFGGDAPLAWDEQRGERVFAHLGSCVRAFFANGGRRCWVVRVARSAALEAVRGEGGGDEAGGVAVSNRFALPGLLAVAAGGSVQAATAVARCEGSWSDGLRAGTAVLQRGIALEGWTMVGAPSSGRYAFTTRAMLRAGELLQLGLDEPTRVYAVVRRIDTASTEPAALQRVEVQLCAAFEPQQDLPAPAAGLAQVAGFGPAVAATWLGPDGLRLDEPVSASLRAGHWVHFAGTAGVVWQRIDEIDYRPAFTGSPASLDTDLMHATLAGPAWRQLDSPADAVPAAVSRAQVLAMDLRVTDAAALDARLPAPTLTPAAEGSFWEQQRDAEFYAPRDGANATPRSEQDRFPLAPEPGTPPLAWLPLGVDSGFGAALAPLPAPGTALERDGLATLSSELFIDPALAGDSTETLLPHAEAIRLAADPARRLFGLHAVLDIGAGGLFSEASLLALPDAVHLGWQRRADDHPDLAAPRPQDTPAHWVAHRGPCSPAPVDQPVLDGPDFGTFLDCATRALHAPVLDGPDRPLPPGTYRLAWTDSEPGPDTQYSLWEAGSADFTDEREVHRGSGTQYVALAQREGIYHYRVFAHVGEDRSGGSNAVTVQVRADEWVLRAAAVASLEMESHWLDVQRAALRLAAACGDLFVVLSMPRHFRGAQAVRHARQLRQVQAATAALPSGASARSALRHGEAHALSYGALYFPWLQVDTGASGSAAGAPRTARVVPPDGVAMGVLAARASRRGAWVAAANEPMKDVVALRPAVPTSDWQALQDEQVNLLRQDPRGFFTLSADTLSLVADLRPINVRRLLILLRRLALRRGANYVFEPNDAVLRRTVQRSFDLLLTDLYRRGAFAGATPAQSFRVVTDDTVQAARDADAGRFFVELRVAPSLPMRFLAVRLTQSGERLSVVEEL